MINDLSIEENYLLPDRIEFSVSTKFIVKSDLDSRDFESYCQAVFMEYLKDKKGYCIYKDKAKNQYYIQVPEDCYKERFPFISNVRLRINNPFTVTLEFNFARFIRYYVEDGSDFDKDYDLSIRVAEDNYINNRVWKGFDYNFIKECSDKLRFKAMDIADFIIGLYVEDFYLLYEIVTVKQIEFNKDYFVGHHRSSDVLHELKFFIISSSGVEWINSLSSVGVSVYNADKSNNVETRFYGDLHNPTFKFPIAKGIYFKVYRKNTDYIRFEITFTKEFIKKRFGRQGLNQVFDPLRKISKEFFRKADFKNVILNSVNRNYSYNFAIVDNIYNIIDRTYPELSSIIDSVSHLNPVSDPDVIRFINGNQRFRGLFVRKTLSNGRKVLLFSDLKDKIFDKNKDKFEVGYDRDFSFMKKIWKSYKNEFPDERVYLSRDGSALVHKGN